MVHDPVSNKTLLFGGSSGEQILDDDWTWDPETASWARASVEPSAQRPSGRYGHAMVFDETNRAVVLFGGETATGKLTDDTWHWHGEKGRWQPVGKSSSSKGPTARQGHRMAYDPVRRVVVLCGGLGEAGDLSDCWQWNGAAWARLPTTDKREPAPRRDFSLVFDRREQALVLFGGRGAGLLGDIWQLESN